MEKLELQLKRFTTAISMAVVTSLLLSVVMLSMTTIGSISVLVVAFAFVAGMAITMIFTTIFKKAGSAKSKKKATKNKIKNKKKAAKIQKSKKKQEMVEDDEDEYDDQYDDDEDEEFDYDEEDEDNE